MRISLLEKRIHFAFEIGLLLKAFNAIIEIAGGTLVLFLTKAYIINEVLVFTQEELNQDPNDAIAQYLITWSNNFSISTQHFITFYLLFHGIVKLVLVVNLFKKKEWAYPVSMGVFGLFIVYQLYRFQFSHSIWLLLFTFFDAIIIWLTFHEYRNMQKRKEGKENGK